MSDEVPQVVDRVRVRFTGRRPSASLADGTLVKDWPEAAEDAYRATCNPAPVTRNRSEVT